jgi:hypothetical protein
MTAAMRLWISPRGSGNYLSFDYEFTGHGAPLPVIREKPHSITLTPCAPAMRTDLLQQDGKRFGTGQRN